VNPAAVASANNRTRSFIFQASYRGFEIVV